MQLGLHATVACPVSILFKQIHCWLLPDSGLPAVDQTMVNQSAVPAGPTHHSCLIF